MIARLCLFFVMLGFAMFGYSLSIHRFEAGSYAVLFLLVAPICFVHGRWHERAVAVTREPPQMIAPTLRRSLP